MFYDLESRPSLFNVFQTAKYLKHDVVSRRVTGLRIPAMLECVQRYVPNIKLVSNPG